MVLSDLMSLPTADFLNPRDRQEATQRVWAECVRYGREARKLKMKVNDCPAYVDLDMAASWRMGWHQENEFIKARAQRAQQQQKVQKFVFGIPIVLDPTMPIDRIDFVCRDGTRYSITNLKETPNG